MSHWAVAALVLAVVFGSALVGVVLHTKLPAHRRSSESRTIVQLVTGLVATMAALVLSLLIASSHTFYDTQEAEVQQVSAHVILLDDVLRRYGPASDSA